MPEPDDRTESLGHELLGCALNVHDALGPGFPERIYERAFAVELDAEGYAFERQPALDVHYRGERVGRGRADLIVDHRVVLELKSVSDLRPVHRAQVYSYLRASGIRLGFVLNFNNRLLRDGIERVVRADGDRKRRSS